MINNIPFYIKTMSYHGHKNSMKIKKIRDVLKIYTKKKKLIFYVEIEMNSTKSRPFCTIVHF